MVSDDIVGSYMLREWRYQSNPLIYVPLIVKTSQEHDKGKKVIILPWVRCINSLYFF
jgi:hypothetical protein